MIRGFSAAATESASSAIAVASGAGGEAGVDRALTILREQVERSMALTGFATIADITRDRVSVRGQTHS